MRKKSVNYGKIEIMWRRMCFYKASGESRRKVVSSNKTGFSDSFLALEGFDQSRELVLVSGRTYLDEKSMSTDMLTRVRDVARDSIEVR